MPNDSTLAGGSVGGLFDLYTLFHNPDSFNRYLVASPSIWWDSQVIFQYEEAYAADHNGLPATVFMSVGSDEGTDMVDPMEAMAQILRERGYPDLVLETHIFEGESHASAAPASWSRGLRVLYAQAASD